MASAILSVIAFLVLIVWRFVFVFASRHRGLLARVLAPQQQRQNDLLEKGLHISDPRGVVVITDHRFANSSDGLHFLDRKDRAKTYLRRIAALTGATQTGDAYVLDVDKMRFRVRDRSVSRLRDMTDPGCALEETAFISRTKECRKRRKLLRRCCSSRTIQGCLTVGPLRAELLGLTASLSAPRRNSLAMRMQTKFTPAQRASKYLKRVAALIGAEQIRGDSYWLRAGRRNFLVDHKFVRLVSHHGKSTCFSIAADPDMPSAEVVASALLHL